MQKIAILAVTLNAVVGITQCPSEQQAWPTNGNTEAGKKNSNPQSATSNADSKLVRIDTCMRKVGGQMVLGKLKMIYSGNPLPSTDMLSSDDLVDCKQNVVPGQASDWAGYQAETTEGVVVSGFKLKMKDCSSELSFGFTPDKAADVEKPALEDKLDLAPPAFKYTHTPWIPLADPIMGYNSVVGTNGIDSISFVTNTCSVEKQLAVAKEEVEEKVEAEKAIEVAEKKMKKIVQKGAEALKEHEKAEAKVKEQVVEEAKALEAVPLTLAQMKGDLKIIMAKANEVELLTLAINQEIEETKKLLGTQKVAKKAIIKEVKAVKAEKKEEIVAAEKADPEFEAVATVKAECDASVSEDTEDSEEDADADEEIGKGVQEVVGSIAEPEVPTDVANTPAASAVSDAPAVVAAAPEETPSATEVDQLPLSGDTDVTF